MSSIYTEMPYTTAFDERTQHRDIFGELAHIYDINVHKSRKVALHSLGIGERYHDTLRKTFLKLCEAYHNLKKDTVLALAVKAINDTLGPEGIVPSAPVFGEYPSIRSFLGTKIPRPTLAGRASAAQDARKIMSKHMTRAKVRRALKHRTPRSADYTFCPGDKVLVWMQNHINNRFGVYNEPFSVLSFDPESKIVLVEDEPGKTPKRYNVSRVKPYLINTEPVATEYMQTVKRDMHNFNCHNGTTEIHVHDCSSVKVSQSDKNYYFDRRKESKIQNSSVQVHLTELIKAYDPRAKEPRMREAMYKGIKCLIDCGTF